MTYRTDESLAFPEYDIHLDRAYWVSEIRGRAEGYIDVDAETRACGGADPVYGTGNDAGVGPAAFTWVSEHREMTGSEPFPATAHLDATLGNVRSLQVDAIQACLAGVGLTYRIETDGPAAATVVEPGRGLPATGGAGWLGGLMLAAAGYGFRKRRTWKPVMTSTSPAATGTRISSV